jgi:hypothetical protein
MGTTRPKIQDLMPLVDRLERRLVATSTFLAYGGRLQLIRSCLSSMPIFFMCSLDIPPGIIKQLNRIIRHCLWSDRKSDSKGKSLAAWDMICKPKQKGGLGILDFKKQNEALLMKHLHKFYNKEDLPWVKLVWSYYPNGVPQATNLCGSFWWRDIMKLVDKYIAVCNATAGCGDSILFWNDTWNGILPSKQFPRLHSFALDTLLSVREVVQCEDRSTLLYLPLLQQAYDKYINMQSFMDSIHLNYSEKDVWRTIWKQGIFSAHFYYQHCFSHIPTRRLHCWI